VVRAQVAAKNTDVQLLIGSQFQLSSANGHRLVSFIVIARNREGQPVFIVTLSFVRAFAQHHRQLGAKMRIVGR